VEYAKAMSEIELDYGPSEASATTIVTAGHDENPSATEDAGPQKTGHSVDSRMKL